MATEQQVDLELILVFIEHAEAMNRYLRDAIDRLEYALLVQLNRADELDPQLATRQPTPAPVPRAPRFPIQTGDTPSRDVLAARLLVSMLRLVATMSEVQDVFGYFERAIASVQQEEEEDRRGQRLEDGDRDGNTE